MVLGVECAKVLLVFLSKEYLASANCQLEFRYAVQRGKAFVILRTESNLQIEQWILEAIQGFPQYDVYSYEILGELINGVPLVSPSFVLSLSLCRIRMMISFRSMLLLKQYVLLFKHNLLIQSMIVHRNYFNCVHWLMMLETH